MLYSWRKIDLSYSNIKYIRIYVYTIFYFVLRGSTCSRCTYFFSPSPGNSTFDVDVKSFLHHIKPCSEHSSTILISTVTGCRVSCWRTTTVFSWERRFSLGKAEGDVLGLRSDTKKDKKHAQKQHNIVVHKVFSCHLCRTWFSSFLAKNCRIPPASLICDQIYTDQGPSLLTVKPTDSEVKPTDSEWQNF